MAVAYKNSWTNFVAAATNTVSSISVAAGDLLLAFIQKDGTGNDARNWPSGFVEISSGISTFDGGQFAVAYKVATGAETSLAFSLVGGASIIAGVLAYSGVDTTTPLDVAGVGVYGNTGGVTFDASITPVTNGCMIVNLCGPDTGDVDQTFTFTTVSGTTDAWSTRIDQRAGFFNVGVADATQATAGALTARAQSLAGQNAGQMSVLVALRAAPTGPTHIASYQNATTGSGSSSDTISGVAVLADDIIAVFTGVNASASGAFTCSDNASGGSNTYLGLTEYGDFANAGAAARWFIARAKATETLTLTLGHAFNDWGGSVHVIRGISNGIALASLALVVAGNVSTALQPTHSITPGAVPGAVFALTGVFSTNGVIGFSGTTIDVGTNTPATFNSGLSSRTARVSWKNYPSAQSSETWTQTSTANDKNTLVTIYLDGTSLPAFTLQPVGVTAPSGTSVTLTATATTTSGTPTYQWQKWNGSSWVNETGETGASITRSAPAAGSADLYRVVATSSAGSVNSNTAGILAPWSGLAAPWGAI